MFRPLCLKSDSLTKKHGKVKLAESFLLVQGSMLQVSSHFLEQTLDKKLMSDLRVSY